MSGAIAEGVLAGDPRAVARAISLIEDGGAAGVELIRRIYGKTGRAYLLGVTGPPGAGKSTLVDRMIAGIRGRGLRVGVIAVDPSSPFTGGAVLGDRLRMQAHALDRGVFIRSMATRGHLGGLSAAAADAALVLDAAGTDVVLIETVGVGQDEIDIARTADASVVVLVPEAGDEVQALKAGIMEIADIFVVNKADRDGADRLGAAIESNLSLQAFAPNEWRPPIMNTVATTGAGVPELLDTLWRFRERPDRLPRDRRLKRSESHVRALVAARLVERLEREVLVEGELAAIAERVTSRELDPYTAADQLLARTFARDPRPS